jgi:hypothetical protein
VAQERIEYLFAAQVQGQREMQQLVASVDKLRQEVEALKTANGGLAASTDAVIRNGKRYNNALDAQSKAMRNARQGTQQLGMQVNDFFTSVSTGASPVQAFNQQIGQVGFALSMMEGRLGMLGRFIAGPFGIVLMGATLLFSQFKGETDKAADGAANFGDYTIATFQSIGSEIKDSLEPAIIGLQPALKALEPVVQGVSVFFSNLLQVGKQMANGLIRVFVAATNTIAILVGNSFGMVGEMAINAFNGVIFAVNKLIAEAEGTLNLMGGYINQFMAYLGISFRFGEASFGRLEYATNKWAGTSKKAFSDVGAALQDTLGREFINIGDIQSRAGDLALGRKKDKKDTGGGGDGAKKEKEDQLEINKALGDYLKLLEKGTAPLTAYQERIYALAEAYGKLAPAQQAAFAAVQQGALDQADMDQISRDAKALQSTLDNGLLPAIAEMASKPTEAMTSILTRGEEMKTSFEAVGNSVSDAFQGMLTGATSFKDGMKGIINSVISELWRLYVVQQIVGFVTKAISGIGLPLPQARAIGGSVNSNQPYMVGEKGPELFVPRGNGTIIPNHNMKGGAGAGGINITVDARGSSDPAAVRAQVQQGILEAAPAIIAAAEARTNRGLRRPRLAGVMQ